MQRVKSALRRLDRRLPTPVRRSGRNVVRRALGRRAPVASVVLTVPGRQAGVLHHALDSVCTQSHGALDIVVAPHEDPDGRVADRVRELARADTRLRVLPAAADRVAARNAGADAARGDYLMFLTADDALPHNGVERLVGSLEQSGSDLAFGRSELVWARRKTAQADVEALHDHPQVGATLTSLPQAIADLELGSRLFRRSFWRSASLGFEATDRSGGDLSLDSLARAGSFDVLRAVTYRPGSRKGKPVGHLDDALANLDGWLGEQAGRGDRIDALGVPGLLEHWVHALLDRHVQVMLDDTERATDAQWSSLRRYVGGWLDDLPEGVWPRLRVESRVKLRMLQQDCRRELAELVARRWFEQGNIETRVEDGVVVADLGVPVGTCGVTAEDLRMHETESALKVVLRAATWVDGQLDLTFHAWIDFVSHDGETPRVEVALVSGRGDRIALPVRQSRSNEVNVTTARRYQDHDTGELSVRVDPAVLADRAAPHVEDGSEDAWTLEVSYACRGVERRGPVTGRDDRGSAGLLSSRHLAPRRQGDLLVGTAPTHEGGLELVVRPAAAHRLADATVSGRRVSGTLDATGGLPRAVRVRGPRGVVVAADVDAEGRFVVDVPVPRGVVSGVAPQAWQVRVVDADGEEHPLGWPPHVTGSWVGTGGELVVTRSVRGNCEVVEATDTLVVDRLAVTDGALEATVRWLGPVPASSVLHLDNGRVSVEQVSWQEGEPGARVVLPLEHDAWGLGSRPLPLGRYALQVTCGHGDGRRGPGRVVLGPEVVDGLVDVRLEGGYRWRPFRDAHGVGVVLAKPLTDDERGPYRQHRLQQWCLQQDEQPDPQVVLLSAYGGRTATDSPLALHEELRRTRPDLRLFWGVADPAASVPEGGVPVLIGSREWYHVLGTAGHLVNNIDFDRWFTPREGQRFLQTFHGYPSKSMGIRLWEAKQFTPLRVEAELRRTSADWDLILTPTPEMDQYYRTEYRYDGPIHSAGYPRDDVLVGPDRDRIRRETRERLGISEGQTVVLYAPTWRDDLATNYRSAQLVRHLDLETASTALGDDFVFLMRGHRFHARGAAPGGRTARLVDVTDYPEINDLILASDAAVLDYSSLRFDFALTGRPMLFLVPDLGDYTGNVRGFLYPFEDTAPGPLLKDADEVVRDLQRLDRVAEEYADAQAAFHQKYNYLQDGKAAARVVEAFLGAGPGVDTIRP